jgi:hypothetical protein
VRVEIQRSLGGDLKTQPATRLDGAAAEIRTEANPAQGRSLAMQTPEKMNQCENSVLRAHGKTTKKTKRESVLLSWRITNR